MPATSDLSATTATGPDAVPATGDVPPVVSPVDAVDPEPAVRDDVRPRVVLPTPTEVEAALEGCAGPLQQAQAAADLAKELQALLDLTLEVRADAARRTGMGGRRLASALGISRAAAGDLLRRGSGRDRRASR